ncbi:tetratricopeptide repeat protein [Paraburkholderia atlantica]|uniref:tetratricopeptide repeat protein n=1 Tax=Paraburkholderia atlantica TaxID=2654982 RepID=UPI003D219B94
MQEASVTGTGNTVVQIVGDCNRVTAGYPHLTLTRYLARRQIRQDLDRLSPYTRSTPLLGRETELASLHAFLNAPAPMLARVLVGGGGGGKTRLALELCEQASATGWNAGFVTRTELHRFFAAQNLSDWGWQKPTLIVVDYAAEHAELLGRWLDELTDRVAPPQHVLRLLLLERSARTDAGWWTTVFASGGWGAANKRALLDPAEPVPILPLAHVEDRLKLLEAMLSQASAGPPIGRHYAAYRDKLMQLEWSGDPLFLMMAALAMVQVGPANPELGRTDLADALAGREADRLQQLARARSLDPALVQHLAACVTLAQGMSREDFERFASSEKAAINRSSGGDAAVLADVLHEALPRTNGISPVLPDLIGEALIMRTMRHNAGASAVLRCHSDFGRTVAASVIRCAQDFAGYWPAPLQWLEGIIDSLGEDEDALAALADSLPKIDGLVFKDLNLKLAERLLSLCDEREDTPIHKRATTLNRLAHALAEAGQREPALQATQEALELFRELATQQPDVFRYDLAMSLHTLADSLDQLGQREVALQAAQEALELYLELATQQPDDRPPSEAAGGVPNNHSLATQLRSLAISLSDWGQRERALQAAQAAVDVSRELATPGGTFFLTTSLDTLVDVLSDLGQHEPALRATQEVTDLFRELGTGFRPDVAWSLRKLAIRFSDLGQRELALQAAQEALELHRELAAQGPDEYWPEVAASLSALAHVFIDLDQRESALKAAQEAVDLARELVAAHGPYAYGYGAVLARSLLPLSIMLSDLGQRKPALQAAQEAVDLSRELVAQEPDAFRPVQAGALFLLARLTRDVSGAAEALPFAKEAITTLAPDFLGHPNAHTRLMEATCDEYLQLCESAGVSPDRELMEPLMPYFANKE